MMRNSTGSIVAKTGGALAGARDFDLWERAARCFGQATPKKATRNFVMPWRRKQQRLFQGGTQGLTASTFKMARGEGNFSQSGGSVKVPRAR